MNTKQCPRCGEAKPVDAFHVDRRAKDGRRVYCKVCACRKVRKWRAANPDKVREHNARFRAANPEYGREWDARNRDKRCQYTRRWGSRNRSKRASYCQNYKARKLSAHVEDVDRHQVYERDGGKCHICGKHRPVDDWHLDHLVPLSKGGEHSYRNVAVSCPGCNIRKRDTGPAQLRLVG